MSQTLDETTRGALYQELLDHDSRTVPDTYRWQSLMGEEALRVPVRRYTDPEYHRLEVERVWKKVWQMACREEDVPEVGDHVNYEIAGMDVIIVRSEGGVIKAPVEAIGDGTAVSLQGLIACGAQEMTGCGL